jgi:hypothetical protein
MTRSQLLANCHAHRGTDAAHAVVLADAVVLFLAVSQPTIARIVERLGDRHVESSISDDGFCFAVILSAEDWYGSLENVAEEVEGLTIADNREHPCNDLEGFVWMVGWLEQGRQTTDGW